MDVGRFAAVLTADEELLDRLLSTLTAVGMDPGVVSDAGGLRSVWAQAAVVIVGADRAEQLATANLPRRPDVYLVGADAERDRLLQWSVRLGAAIVTLPAGDSWFASVLAEAGNQGRGQGQLIAVVGATGGVGASTCAVGLAVRAAAAGRSTMLIDADPLAGGLDLLLGAERLDGWRWPQLARAHGHLRDLSGLLPQIGGIDLLSAARADDFVDGPVPPMSVSGGSEGVETRPWGGVRRGAGWVQPDQDHLTGSEGVDSESISAEAMIAVLTASTRSHNVTVADLPRWPTPAGTVAAGRADFTALVVRADLRGLAAAREVLGWIPAENVQLLLRRRRLAGVGPELAEETLGFPVSAVIPDDPGLRLAAERGDSPGQADRSALAKACRLILAQLPVPTEVFR